MPHWMFDRGDVRTSWIKLGLANAPLVGVVALLIARFG